MAKITLELEDQLDLDIIKRRSVTGVVALASRSLFLQLLTFTATFLLTVFLSPAEFGVFFIVSALVNFLVYFSDIGLAAALIQKKEKISTKDLATTFTIQQLLVLSLVVIALLLSQPIAQFYQLNQAGIWLLRSLVIAFFLSSLKTIPSILLERKLQFNKLILPQIIENIFFYATAVLLATQGFGVTSFTYAVLLRGLSGLIAIYLLSPWLPRFALDLSSAKQLLRFGLPFQFNSFLALIKDDLLTAFLGKILPLIQVGYLGWAQRWALMPFRFFSESLIKVTFPAYSRLQEHHHALKKAIEKSLFAIASTVFPSLAGLLILAPYLVQTIPRYQKWQPALFALIFFAINSAFASLSTTLTNTLNALGKINLTLKLMIFWTVLTWLLTPLLVFQIGFNGAALAAALVALTSIITVFLVKKVIAFNLLPQITSPMLATAFMSLTVFIISHLLPLKLTFIPLLILIGVVSYTLALLALARTRVAEEWALVRKYLRHEQT